MRSISERISAVISQFYNISPDEVEVFHDAEIGKWISRYGHVAIASEKGLSTIVVEDGCREMIGSSRVRTDINSTSVHMLTRTLIEASKRAKEGARLASLLIQAGFDVHGEFRGRAGEVSVSHRIPLSLEITLRPGNRLGEWELANDPATLSGERMALLDDVAKALESMGIPRSSGEED